jgi:hypothetical protein
MWNIHARGERPHHFSVAALPPEQATVAVI